MTNENNKFQFSDLVSISYPSFGFRVTYDGELKEGYYEVVQLDRSVTSGLIVRVVYKDSDDNEYNYYDVLIDNGFVYRISEVYLESYDSTIYSHKE